MDLARLDVIQGPFEGAANLSTEQAIPGTWFNIKMSSYQYRKSHCGDKTVVRSSYLHNGISYTDKMSSLYWDGTQAPSQYKDSLSRGGDFHYKDKTPVTVVSL